MDSGEAAHEALYNRKVQAHAIDLRSWLHRRFPGLKDPENVVQEALMRVWRRMASQPFEGSPRALLFVTARNLAIDEIRRNQIIRMDAVAELDSLPVYTSDSNAADMAAKNQELELLTLAIQSLPPRCRQVLTLRKIYGLSQKEIAAEMGISEHTVEAQVANGMRRCADFLKKYGLP
jgi:RNA polymerase sigma factor (sigma-70 family)